MKTKISAPEDVASTPPGPHLELPLEEVGLEHVQTQIFLDNLRLPAKAEASVSLRDPRSRGIHMSRIFRVLNDLHSHELTWPWLDTALERILASHADLSDTGRLSVQFDLPVRRRALLSAEEGWRNYPVGFHVSAGRGERRHWLTTRVLYSSTCPCSAALTRHAIRDQFLREFAEAQVSRDAVSDWLGRASSYVAFPHSQRSEALCEFHLEPSHTPPSILDLIDLVESALGTAVQAAVKREDEQEFARLNARNLMFCEDAARKLKAALVKRSDLRDFHIEVRHFESLHAHDVVAKAGKFN
ncbi:MAG: GTP cyclohydrolase FolE2 [Bdellovibrionales bacterium]